MDIFGASEHRGLMTPRPKAALREEPKTLRGMARHVSQANEMGQPLTPQEYADIKKIITQPLS